MVGLNFYVESINPQTYWVGLEMTLPVNAYIIPDTTAVIIEDAVVRSQYIEFWAAKPQKPAKILINVYTKQPILKGYIKTVICSNTCKPEKIAFEVDLKRNAHFYHNQWTRHALSSSWVSGLILFLMILGGVFVIGLVAFLVTMGIMFGLYLFTLIAGLYVAIFMLLFMAGAIHNVYEFCANYWRYECCFKPKKVPEKLLPKNHLNCVYTQFQ